MDSASVSDGFEKEIDFDSSETHHSSEAKYTLSYTNESLFRASESTDEFHETEFHEETLETSSGSSAEREWNSLKEMINEGEVRVANHPTAQRVVKGFRIVYMNIKDENTGELLWEAENMSAPLQAVHARRGSSQTIQKLSRGRNQVRNMFEDLFETEVAAHVPKKLLDCETVSREIRFYSRHTIESFRLEQRVFYEGSCIESWRFKFGFVMPGSTNTWQQVLHGVEENRFTAEMLSGKVTIETSFFDGDFFLCKTLVRIFYD